MNLLIYQTKENGLSLKLWGIKSCVFVTAGTYLGICFAQQMCDLSDFRNRNHLIRQELFLKSQEEEKLRVEAYEDRLTGCYTRLYAEKTCFPSASNPIAFPCANGIFTATLKERITHYTLQVKSCAKSTPFGPPGQQNRLNIPYFPGA